MSENVFILSSYLIVWIENSKADITFFHSIAFLFPLLFVGRLKDSFSLSLSPCTSFSFLTFIKFTVMGYSVDLLILFSLEILHCSQGNFSSIISSMTFYFHFLYSLLLELLLRSFNVSYSISLIFFILFLLFSFSFFAHFLDDSLTCIF